MLSSLAHKMKTFFTPIPPEIKEQLEIATKFWKCLQAKQYIISNDAKTITLPEGVCWPMQNGSSANRSNVLYVRECVRDIFALIHITTQQKYLVIGNPIFYSAHSYYYCIGTRGWEKLVSNVLFISLFAAG
jgi:hypothetical protein